MARSRGTRDGTDRPPYRRALSVAERDDAELDPSAEHGPDDDLPLDRRSFLQLGLAGAAIDPEWFDAPTAERDRWVTSKLGGPSRTTHRLGPPSPPRVSFPLVAPLVSVGGLAPPTGTPLGDASRAPDGRFSIKRLAAAYELDRTPTSVRELTTPQRGGPLAASTTTGWENWLQDYALENAEDITLTGDDAAQRLRLIELVVQKTHEKFRAVGSGHSHSEAARPEKFFSDLKAVEGVLPMPWLRASDDPFWAGGVVREHLLSLQAGTVLKRLNRRILQQVGLALPNMGSWDGQTLAGAINTSTHGTGLGLGTFADLVRSVDIVSVPESQYEDGEPHVTMYRVEPTDGITDPETFVRAAGVHNTVLVQDDDLFNAVVVGYGSLGIAYSYTLELQQPYWLREENTSERWGTFDPYALAQANRHFNFLVDLVPPQALGNATPLCLLQRRNLAPANGRTPTERRNVTSAFETPMLALFEFYRDFNDPAAFADRLATIDNDISRLFTGGALSLAALDPPFEPGPDGPRYESAWYIALRRKKEENTDPDVDPKPPIDAITTEIAVPADQVVPAVDRVIQFVMENDRFFPAPLGVRFTDASEQFFSAEYQRPIAMLEFIVPVPESLKENLDAVEIGKVYLPTSFKKIFYQKLKRINRDTGLLEHFIDLSVAKAELAKLEAILVDEFDGRPHLGKFNSVHVDAPSPNLRPQQMFPEYETWAAVESYLNAFGTFDGAFTDNKTRT